MIEFYTALSPMEINSKHVQTINCNLTVNGQLELEHIMEAPSPAESADSNPTLLLFNLTLTLYKHRFENNGNY